MMKMIRKISWFLWFLPFGTFAIVTFIFTSPDVVKDYRNTLLALNVTIAIFAINFGFLEYQFSPYRVLIRPASRRHRWESVLLLLMSLLPLLSITFISEWSGIIALIFLPIIGYCSVLLGVSVSHESRGGILLGKRASIKMLRKFLPTLARDYDKNMYDQEQLNLSSLHDMPMHEWEVRPVCPPIREDDPVEFVTHLAYTALTNNDLNTFDMAVQQLLLFFSEIHNFKIKEGKTKDYEVSSALHTHLSQALELITRFAIATDKSGTFLIRLQDRFGHYIKIQSKDKRQHDGSTRDVFQLMVTLGQTFLERGLHENAMATIIVARQAVQKGIDDPKKDNEGKNDHLFIYSLASYTRRIKQMGTHAIGLRNSNFLYRCLDALAWVGCSSVKHRQYPVTQSCLDGLSQLGRESRAADLRCFWSHCALRPEDHAAERLGWIASWIATSRDERKRPFAVDELAEAYSRLYGYETKISIDATQEKPRITIQRTDKPHQMTYTKDGFSRTIDYADPKTIDEFELWGPPGEGNITVLESDFSGNSRE